MTSHVVFLGIRLKDNLKVFLSVLDDDFAMRARSAIAWFSLTSIPDG